MRFVSFYALLPDLIILNGATRSNILSGPQAYSDAVSLMIESPAVLAETVTIYVHRDPSITDPNDAGWCPLENYASGSLASVTVPTAGKARIYSDPISSGAIMLVASTAVATQHNFKLSKMFTA